MEIHLTHESDANYFCKAPTIWHEFGAFVFLANRNSFLTGSREVLASVSWPKTIDMNVRHESKEPKWREIYFIS